LLLTIQNIVLPLKCQRRAIPVKNAEKMKLHSQIEIDEDDYNVVIDFTANNGNIVIHSVKKLCDGTEATFNQFTASRLYDECHEYAATHNSQAAIERGKALIESSKRRLQS